MLTCALDWETNCKGQLVAGTWLLLGEHGGHAGTPASPGGQLFVDSAF